MDGDDTLTLVLRDFARNMLTDFSIQTILSNLVERIVEVLSVTEPFPYSGISEVQPIAPTEFIDAQKRGRA